MNEAQHLSQLLRETVSAMQSLDEMAGENPTDAVIRSNMNAIRKRKLDLERRLAERVANDNAKSAHPGFTIANYTMTAMSAAVIALIAAAAIAGNWFYSLRRND